MPPNMKLVIKGKDEPLTGVRDQVGYSLGVSSKFAPELAVFGWHAADHGALTAVLARLDLERAEQAELRDKSRKNTEAEHAAVSQAKALKRRLELATTDLFAQADYDDSMSLPVTRDAFQTGRLGALKRSTAKLSSWLADVRPHAVALRAELAPYFGGRDVVAELDAVKSALDAAQARQEVSLAALPAETLDVYEAKGRALLLIERLNRIGRLCFAGNAAMEAMFNKDLLQRARTSRKKPQELATPA